VPYFKAHRFELAAQLMIPKTQHFDALRGEKLVSFFISGAPVRETMSATIEFNREFRDCAEKIEEVNAARILTAEFEFGKTTVAQQTPQSFFGISGLCAQSAREIAGDYRTSAIFAVLRRRSFSFIVEEPPHPRWGRG
jgi:hypothetical protein